MLKTNEAYAVECRDLNFHYVTPRKLRHHWYLPFGNVSFETNYVLKNVNLQIRAGEITALLGKNGSGKTTLIKLITGARFPHSGQVRVFGKNPAKCKEVMGLCLGGSLIYNRLSGRENLEYFGKLYGVQNLEARIRELSDLLGLNDFIDHMVETYSFGMKAKLAIARSIVHSPQLLILDEPTLGIDFQLAQQIRQLIKKLGCTILLTTHYMEEAEMLSDNISIIEKGRILESGTKSEVLGRAGTSSISEAFVKWVDAPTELRVA